MTEHTTSPVKCQHCHQSVASPPVCDYCHALNPIPTVMDCFTLLNMPRQFAMDLDELHRNFVALNRHAHPDFHTAESSQVQQLSLQVSSQINDAYRTLKDPAARAAYLLGLLGGKGSADDKSVPEGFLNTMMLMQEELADAKAAGKTDAITRLRTVLATQRDGLLKRIASLFDEYDQSVACNAVRTDLLGELRKQLNAVSYVKKLLSQT